MTQAIATHEEHAVQTGVVLIPLNKLTKSPANARKTPHAKAEIEALAASIHAKGILQNLVVAPELTEAGGATGFYFVTIGEGRRQAQLLRVKRKQIADTEPVRCVIDTGNDAAEISLDENVTRSAMSVMDEVEAFVGLIEAGMSADDVARRFGCTVRLVEQRLALERLSPKVRAAYRKADEDFWLSAPKSLALGALEAAPAIASLRKKERAGMIAAFQKMKKAELARTAAQTLKGAGWLPELLITPSREGAFSVTAAGERALAATQAA